MKLSAPVHVLKNQAKNLKKSEGISLNRALDLIAQKEGFNSWSLLAKKSLGIYPKRYEDLLGFLNPGDLVVVAARPGYGKTSFTIGLFVKAIQEKRSVSFFFSLSETHMDVARRISVYDETIGQDDSVFRLDYSNEISADYIIERTQKEISKNSVIIVDYLQLLDEKRTNPPVQEQVEKLKAYAKQKGCIIIFLSQVKREIEYRNDKSPTLDDLRLPNPLDVKLFNKGILLYRKSFEAEEVTVTIECGRKHQFQICWDQTKARFY